MVKRRPTFSIEVPSTRISLGSFGIQLDAERASISVAAPVASHLPVWETTPGRPPLAAAVGRDRFGFTRGSFHIADHLTRTYRAEVLDDVRQTGDEVVLAGRMSGGELRFRLAFRAIDERQVSLRASVDGTEQDAINRLVLSYAAEEDEGFFGFGAQYSVLDMNGRLLPIWSQEQGVGRGLQPLSSLLNLSSRGASGSWHTTYTAVPYYVTSRARGLALAGYEYVEFDFRGHERVAIKTFSSTLEARLYSGETPAEVLEAHTSFCGRMARLPEWIHSGAIVRMHGGSEAIRAQVAEFERRDVPLAAVWIEDWCGTRDTFMGKRLWWNWEADRDLYPDWPDLVDELRRRGVRTVCYFNPYLTDASGKRNHRRHLFREARDGGFLVRHTNGTTYTIGQAGFRAAILDLTKSEAREWMKALMREQVRLGVAGWMNDFSEALPPDCVLHSGEDPKVVHNRYVEDWARLAREAVREADGEDDVVFFNRSGSLFSPGYAKLFWLGDQTVTWDHFDGLKTVVTGLLSSGLSGYSLNHGDIGGYLSVSYPRLKLNRSKELFQRWTELCAFTACFRTHDTNQPQRNHQFHSDEETWRHFRRFARVFRVLQPYREALVEEAAQRGLPLVRHLMLEIPDDPVAYTLEAQFLLGSDVLVAPVLDPGIDSVSIYVPAGHWVHPWTDFEHHGPGRWYEMEAPLGRPAVLCRADSTALSLLRTQPVQR